MFSLNLSEMTTFRKSYLLTVSGGFVGFSVYLWIFLLLFFFSPPPSLLQHSFQSHFRATKRSSSFDIHWMISNLYFGTNMPQKNCANSLFDHEHYFQEQLLNMPMHGYFSVPFAWNWSKQFSANSSFTWGFLVPLIITA